MALEEQAHVRKVALLLRHMLAAFGVNGSVHYLNGTPATNPVLFPDMKGLVRYGHSKGLKMGWYFNGCGCFDRSPGA